MTPFGKYIKKWCIDNDHTLTMLAEKMDVSTSYLSASLHGEKSPWPIFHRFCEIVLPIDSEQDKLEWYAVISEMEIKIDMRKLSYEKRALIVEFAEKLRNLTDDQIDQIWQVLGGKPPFWGSSNE